jgi:hypothetical protein
MPQIKHMVILKFKPEVSQATIDDLFEQLAGLQSKIDGILDFSGGAYSSHEGLNGGYTHGFCMTFSSAAARDAYLPHPDHEIVKGNIIPNIDGVIAFDYEC